MLPLASRDRLPSPDDKRPGSDEDDDGAVLSTWHTIQRSTKRGCGDINKPNCIMAVLAFAALLFVLRWMFCHPGAYFFRESVAIEPMARHVIMERYRARMKSYLEHHTEMCGLAAASIRVYEQYALLRREDDNAYLDLFNAKYVGIGRTITIAEEAPMCPAPKTPKNHERYRAIDVTYDSYPDTNITARFVGNEAICIQHMVDVMKGYWPCTKPDEKDPEAYYYMPIPNLDESHSEL